MPLPFVTQLLVSVAIQIVGYLLLPTTPEETPASLSDFDDPTAEAGRPIIVMWGSGTITGLNILDYNDKAISKRNVSVDKK